MSDATQPRNTGPREQAPAARSALRILTHLSGQRGPVPAAAIARTLGLPRSSTYHLLAAMADEGYLVHLPEDRAYTLGEAAFGLASGYSRRGPLTRLATPVVARLVEKIGESAHLSVMHGRDIAYLIEERAPHRPPLVSHVGVRLPSQSTASGRAMLSRLPASQLRALFPSADAFDDVLAGGPRTPAALRAVLAGVHDRGYAWEREEVTPGLSSIALPVVDVTGWPLAAIAVTFRADQHPEDSWAGIVAAIAPHARELERRLRGGSPEPGNPPRRSTSDGS